MLEKAGEKRNVIAAGYTYIELYRVYIAANLMYIANYSQCYMSVICSSPSSSIWVCRRRLTEGTDEDDDLLALNGIVEEEVHKQASKVSTEVEEKRARSLSC